MKNRKNKLLNYLYLFLIVFLSFTNNVFANVSNTYNMNYVVDTFDESNINNYNDVDFNEYSAVFIDNESSNLYNDWFQKPESNNKTNCDTLFDEDVKELINYILSFVRLVVPALIIVLGSIDLFKAVIGNNEDAMKKAQKDFIKRLIFGLAVFLVPSLLNILIWVIESGLGVNDYACQNIGL